MNGALGVFARMINPVCDRNRSPEEPAATERTDSRIQVFGVKVNPNPSIGAFQFRITSPDNSPVTVVVTDLLAVSWKDTVR